MFQYWRWNRLLPRLCCVARQLLEHNFGLSDEVWWQEKFSGNKLMGLCCRIFRVELYFFILFPCFLSFSFVSKVHIALSCFACAWSIQSFHQSRIWAGLLAHAWPVVKLVIQAMRIMSLFPWSDHKGINQPLYIMRQLYELMIEFSYSNFNSHAF